MTRSIREVLAEVELWGDNVAEELKKRGIRGNRNNCWSCPMAVYVKAETGLDEVEVDGCGTSDLRPLGEFVSNPDNVTEFIELFDDGEYPELDADQTKDEEPPEEPDPAQIPLWG